MTKEHDNRSQIQKDCTNLSDTDVELVIGEIYGLRQWRLSYDSKNAMPPTLVGHNGGIWEPEGPNYAECRRAQTSLSEMLSLPASHVAEADDDVLGLLVKHLNDFVTEYPKATKISVAIMPTRALLGNKILRVTEQLLTNPEQYPDALPWKIEREGSTFYVEGVKSTKTHLEFRITAQNPPPPHVVTDPDCVCGFYAYTNPESLQRNSTAWNYVVFGLIKAYGRVTQGTQGFRAEKAEILALTRPMHRVKAAEGERRKTFGFFLPLPYYTGGPWELVEDQEINEVFDFFVPGSVAIHDDLDHLLQTASHFIEFPEEDATSG